MPAPEPSQLFDQSAPDDLNVLVVDDVGVVAGAPDGVYVKHPDGWRLAS